MTFFEILAECSIALAGFGAIHAALRGSTGPRGDLRAWTVVTSGSLAFLLGILPLALALASLSDEVLWRIASSFGVIGCGAALVSFLRFDIRLTRLGHRPQATPALRTGQVLSACSALVMLMNLIGWPSLPGPALYALALLFQLLAGLLALLLSFFVPLTLILEKGEAETPGNPPAV
jgi:hypothetical protein